MNQIIKTPAAGTAFANAFAQSPVVPIDNEPLVMGVPRSKSPGAFSRVDRGAAAGSCSRLRR
jgi:hypothetical protein